MGYVSDLQISNIPPALLTILLCVIISGNSLLPSCFFLHLALGSIVVPSLVLYCGANLPMEFLLTLSSAFVVMGGTARIVEVPRLKVAEISNAGMLRILVAVSLVSVLALFAFGGGRYLNFDFSVIYDIRRDAERNLPAAFGYVNFVVGKVVIPFGVVIAVLKRRWLYVALLMGCAVFLFGLTSQKSILFNPLVVLFIYYIAGKPRAIRYFVASLISIGVLSAVEFAFVDEIHSDYWFSSLFFRRALMTPSLLNSFYMDWFAKNDFYYWGDSKISFGLVEPPSSLTSTHLIGLEYLGSAEASANTGWIGSGYANGGIIGVLCYSIAIGFLLAFLDAYSKKFGGRLIISFFIISMLTIFTSTDLVTSIITHGLLVGLLLVSMMKPIEIVSRVRK